MTYIPIAHVSKENALSNIRYLIFSKIDSKHVDKVNFSDVRMGRDPEKSRRR